MTDNNDKWIFCSDLYEIEIALPKESDDSGAMDYNVLYAKV